MRKLHFLKLAVPLLAAAIVSVSSSFDASADKKCITIGQKSICFDDGKGQNNNNGGNAGQNGGGGNQGGGGEGSGRRRRRRSGRWGRPRQTINPPNHWIARKRNATLAKSSSTSPANTEPAARRRKGYARTTGRWARRQTAARTALSFAKRPAIPRPAGRGNGRDPAALPTDLWRRQGPRRPDLLRPMSSGYARRTAEMFLSLGQGLGRGYKGL